MKRMHYLDGEIKQHLPSKNDFDAIMQLTGKVFRDVPGRTTIQVKLGGKSYFVKQHFGVGWREIFKNIFSLKKPVLGAMTEVAAIKALGELNIPTTPLAAYGQCGWDPAAMQSFVITKDLGDIISLEDLCSDWKKSLPKNKLKKDIIIAVARLAARLHGARLCHRDFYLCHFVIKKADLNQGRITLHLIDLHRALHNQSSSGSAVMKDIAALYFSAMDCGFDAKDGALFKQYYLPQDNVFWQKVVARAQLLYAKFNSNKFQQKLSAKRLK